jgi:hypothetical protein
MSQLKDIATNFGEFDFTCGDFANGPLGYHDKEIFGNQCSMTEMLFPAGQPQMRFAILYPGGVAFSGDSGATWLPLNATNAAASQQPIELPQSAFYDQTVNAFGNSSLYVALQGKGVKRMDGPYITLGSGKQAPPTFQATDAQNIFDLGTDGKLWLVQPPFGRLPPGNRHQLDGNVATFQAIDSNHALVVGSDANLWLEHAPFGQLPPPGRVHIDGSVDRVQSVDANHILVLGINGNLWMEEPPFGTVPPVSRQQVDGSVGAFQALDANHVLVLGTNGNLWLEQAPFGTVPPTNRVQIDGDVESFQPIDINNIVVLGRNG